MKGASATVEPIVVVGTGKARLGDVEAWRDLPEFRKASVPMMLAAKALEHSLASLTPSALRNKADLGLVVGVDHGELEVTKDFLVTLAQKGIARPFLFQSALHNATLGFLSMRHGLTGPGLTTSTHEFAGEDALELAADLVRGGDAPA